MPFNRVAALQLGVLLLAFPLQYWISEYYSSSNAIRSDTLKRLVYDTTKFTQNLFTWKTWLVWCNNLIDKFKLTSTKDSFGVTFGDNSEEDENGQSPAVEVLNYEDPRGYFARSPEPRTRTFQVEYRVGQVVKHKVFGYKGVIIGWDHTAKAPEEWLKQMHPPDKPHLRQIPNYAIMVDVRNRPDPQVTYVPQDNIEVLKNTKIMHPEVETFFEFFDGSQYIARPWLKHLYPQDQ